MGYWNQFPPSRPCEAKGGIKAQGKGTKNWWARRWLETLESYGLGARLSRGRSYARGGQVLSIDVSSGSVTGRVQGSRAKPYSVTVKVKTLSGTEWTAVIESLKEQAVFAAKLLAGEMPQEIESVFASAQISLFPSSMNDLTTDCSCPDWSNPCKHTAAVYILLGEEFDRDPFLLFTLRGITRDELLQEIAGARGSTEAKAGHPAEPEPLPLDLHAFWWGGPLPDRDGGEARMPPIHAGVLKRLGGFPFWRGDVPPVNSHEPVYQAASARGLSVYVDDPVAANAPIAE